MALHLPTLLSVWVSIDFVIGLAFCIQHWRIGHVGGPRWWALACLLHTLGAITLVGRPFMPEWLGLPLSNLLFTLGYSALWAGMRAYLGLPLRSMLTGVAEMFVVAWLLYDFFIVVVDSLAARQLLWGGTNVGVLWLMLRDAKRNRPQPPSTEFRGLAAVLWFQILLLLGYVYVSVVLEWPFERTAALITYCSQTAFLLFMLTFQCLLMLRLRDDAQAARSEQLRREADLQRLVDSLDVGVMEFQPDHTLWTMNKAAQRLLTSSAGPNPPMAINYANLRILDEHGRPLRSHEKPLERILISGDPLRDLVVGISLDGDEHLKWALCSGYPEFDSEGVLCRVVLTFIDVTVTRAAQLERQVLANRKANS